MLSEIVDNIYGEILKLQEKGMSFEEAKQIIELSLAADKESQTIGEVKKEDESINNKII